MTATVRGISVEGRQGSIDDAAKEFTVVYKVWTDDRNDGPGQVMSAFGVPTLGDLYQAGNDFDPNAICIAKRADQNDTPWEWFVECTFTTEPDAQPTELPLDPLLQDPEVSYGFQERRILVPGIYNDPLSPPASRAWESGIFAPNGELFDPQPEMDISEPVLTIKRNVQTISGVALMSLANAVNSDFWQNAEPRQLRLSAPQAVRKFHKAIGVYWEVTYSIAFRWQTWDVQILNQGHFYWAGGKPASVWSTTTLPAVKKILSGEPRLINLTTNGDINTTSTPTFTRYRVYREIPFSTLGLL